MKILIRKQWEGYSHYTLTVRTQVFKTYLENNSLIIPQAGNFTSTYLSLGNQSKHRKKFKGKVVHLSIIKMAKQTKNKIKWQNLLSTTIHERHQIIHGWFTVQTNFLLNTKNHYNKWKQQSIKTCIEKWLETNSQNIYNGYLWETNL